MEMNMRITRKMLKKNNLYKSALIESYECRTVIHSLLVHFRVDSFVRPFISAVTFDRGHFLYMYH